MKRILTLIVTAAAVLVISHSTASAQGCFGRSCFGGGFFGLYPGMNGGISMDQPPYFAKFPPVYYSHIVKRPYGISPFAAPPGVVPVEMNTAAPAEPLTVTNPFFHSDTQTASAHAVQDNHKSLIKKSSSEKKANRREHQTTWIKNRFYEGDATPSHTILPVVYTAP